MMVTGGKSVGLFCRCLTRDLVNKIFIQPSRKLLTFSKSQNTCDLRWRNNVRVKHFSTSPVVYTMEGKTALVTGSTSGIGLGVARALAGKGCNILLNGFGEEALIQELKEEFTKTHGVNVEYFDTDLSSPDQILSMCTKINNDHPSGIDILVNNAGIQHVAPIEDFPLEKWNSMVSVMLTAPFLLTKYLLPKMKEKGWGRIVNIGSVHSQIASPGKTGYCAVKHGMLGVSKVVALDTAGSGVTCNTVCPGFVNTIILQTQVQALADKKGLSYEDAKKEFLANVHPSKETVGVEQIGEAVLFLCSDAASQMTGSALTMDGGWTAR